MNKINSEIVKSLKQIRAEAADKIKKLFKQKGVVLMDCACWNEPREEDFKTFGADARLYVMDLRSCMTMKINTCRIENMLISPEDAYEFVTKEELKNFEKDVYPKLYARWLAEQKQKATEANVKNAEKLRAKIAKLQAKLDELEA